MRTVDSPLSAGTSDGPKGAVALARPTLERLYDASPEPVVLVEPQRGRLLYCNQTFMDLCGLRPHAARRLLRRGAPITEVLSLDDHTQLETLVRRAAELGLALGASSVRGRARSDTPDEVVLTVTAAPVDFFDHAGAAVVLTFRNTTAEHRVQVKYQRLLSAERRHAEELETKVRERTRELAETQEELLQASRLAAIGEVAGAAAHEVFNPLTAVAGNLDSMRSALVDECDTVDELKSVARRWTDIGTSDDPARLLDRLQKRDDEESDLELLGTLAEELEHDLARRRRRLDMLCNASHRIERIVQGMLGMSRGQAEPEPLPLATVFREVKDLMTYSFDRAGVRLDMKPGRDIVVFADRGELLQVLTNLLRNACQAATAAHGRSGGLVRATAKVRAQLVEIRVDDNGVGIDDAARARAFEAGFTTKPRGEGSGLGLPISRRLMRRNGGDLVLEASRPGHGTTMLATLPVAVDSGEAS